MMEVTKIEKLSTFGIELKVKVRVDNVPLEVSKVLFKDTCKVSEYSETEGYLIFIDTETNKTICFTKKVDCFRNQNDNAFEYLEPCEFCKDADRI